MFDAEEWNAKIEGTDCVMCRLEQLPIVTELKSGKVILVDDAVCPGYCILVYRRHATELYELTQDERAQFMEDISHIAQALKNELRPAKLNYAILGNEVPHLHCHIIPRFPDDPLWGAAIWKRPTGPTPGMPPAALDALVERLRGALGPR